MSEWIGKIVGAIVTVFLVFVGLAVADHFTNWGLVTLTVNSIHTAINALKSLV